MKWNKKVLFFLFISVGCTSVKVVQSNRSPLWAEKINTTGLSNFYKIDANLYRSEQPNAKEMTELSSYGIKTVINLRKIKNDKQKSQTTLNFKHKRINTWTMSYKDIVKTMKMINSSEKPVLIHCLHGSDRTGCIAAVYRMLYCGWTKQEAIDEFINGGYGYHANWFPNILRLLNSLDVEKLKKDIENV